MKTMHLLAALFAVTWLDAYAAMDHSAHRGSRGAGGGESSGANCVRPHLDKIKPAHLSTIAPGTDFSFVVFNIDNPDQVSVKVKQQPVEVETEYKDPFYVVKGKIPDSLHNTAARIDVKIDSKHPSCRAEQGWLVKISEN